MKEKKTCLWIEIVGGVMLVLAVVASGCSGKTGNTISLDEQGTGSTVEMAVGDVLEVSLASNPTTGYSWFVGEGDTQLLPQVGETEYNDASQPGVLGGGGTEKLTFEAKAAGSLTLTLIYHRPWEKDVAPLQTYTLNINIQ